MGKSRKYSKGNLSGFVPDYRHAVETVAESEGFGSSGRVDAEMTLSEGSYAPKRKLISLNPDGHDGFGVPIQILPLSKMSRSQRKDLELRLKKELELVRVLQKKVASLNTNAVMLSPSSDIWSCSDGQKKPSVDGLHRSVEVSASQSRKKVPPGRNRARTKKDANGHHEPAKPAAVSSSNDTLMKQCKTLLHEMMKHKYGWVFNKPVDVVKLKIPDYFSVIKHPMDLGTVKSKIVSGAYASPLEFAADVRLTFSNALKYNPPGNDVHFMAEEVSKFFESKWKAIEKKLPGVESVYPSACVTDKMETNTGINPSKKKKIGRHNTVKSEPVTRVMTDEEKHNLSMELEVLLGELPERIIDFLKEQSHNAEQTGEDEIEIDIDSLSNDTLFKLRKLVDDYLLEKQQKPAKAEPCEIELFNESGFSNSSLPPCKGNEPVDEDIDIVGGNESNDPLTSSHPPVEIENDAANKNSTCSSPSSSSESGSSSDSDCGSSSESESETAKASVPGTIIKENVGSVENFDEERSDLGDTGIANQSANGLGTVEPDSQGNHTNSEIDSHREGESDPPDRQVSPDKLYRAALLRSRFADTIFKARAKALEKGEKCDPEKLRLEKEELERLQKEEKARLLAEAKAAEEAQRKAAAEAVAEAKRKRELEREAARQALQQMEKTVEINESSLFMEDLEMLRARNDEELPSFIEETIQGSSNPLEQLGLYIKKDEDEEEEVVEPPQGMKDVEDGEID